MVTFFDGGVALGSVPLDAAGRAVLTTAALIPGTHTLTARYGGSTAFTPGNSLPLYQQVIPPDQPAVPQDITNRVLFRRGRRRVRGRFVWQTWTLTYRGAVSVAGPVGVVLDGLARRARLTNLVGLTTALAPLGSPYVRVPAGADGVFSPGETLTLTLILKVPPGARQPYRMRVLAGPGPW
jgi:hypothetical protein